MTQLSELNLRSPLLKALENINFIKATEIQAEVIPEVSAGKDVIASAKTGSGKTAAFILPMLNHFLSHTNAETRGLILLPTRELALQTQKVFEKLAAFTPIKSALIIGGEAFKHQIASIRKNPEVIIATPGRLVEHIEKGNVDFRGLEFYVLDEADRMLDMGFAEDMHTISAACNANKQTLLFSATLKHSGFKRLQSQLNDPVRIITSKTRSGHSDITQQYVLADDDRHKEAIATALIQEESAQRVFIFCKTRAQAQKLSNILRSKKLRADYIHGEVSQNDRKQVLNRFRAGTLHVLVATDLAARGLDIENIDLVINFTMAQSGDDHVHRVGRTGRAGNQGLAVSLVDSSEWNRMSSIERYLKIRFELRKIKGLEANYKGPKKIKKSGKAAGPKKKKNNKAVKKTTKTLGGNRPLTRKK